VNWLYETEVDEGSGGRRHKWPKGKVLGGSSSINGMLYVRGQAADYDGWAQMGARGWSWDEVLPYFRRSQNQERGEDQFHGAGGLGGAVSCLDFPGAHRVWGARGRGGVAGGTPYKGHPIAGTEEGSRLSRWPAKTARAHRAAAASRPRGIRGRTLRGVTRGIT